MSGSRCKCRTARTLMSSDYSRLRLCRHARTSLACRSRTTGKPNAGCSKRPSGKAAANEEASRTLRYVEPLSEARTPLADFFSILPEEVHAVWNVAKEGTVNIALHTRELSRIALDTLEHKVEFVKEPRAQAEPLVFISHGGCLDVEVRLRLDDEPPCHSSDQRSRNLRSMSVRTSVQSRPFSASRI
jgi:hypothetical protein